MSRLESMLSPEAIEMMAEKAKGQRLVDNALRALRESFRENMKALGFHAWGLWYRLPEGDSEYGEECWTYFFSKSECFIQEGLEAWVIQKLMHDYSIGTSSDMSDTLFADISEIVSLGWVFAAELPSGELKIYSNLESRAEIIGVVF